MNTLTKLFSLTLLFICFSAQGSQSGALENVFSAVDMMEHEVILINLDTDEMIQAKLNGLAGWPGGRPQHTVLSPDAKQLYISTDSSDEAPASIVILEIKKINWPAGTVKLKVKRSVTVAPAGSSSSFVVPTQIDPLQPIAAWTQPQTVQLHGPTLLPWSDFLFFTQWTNDQIRVLNRSENRLAEVDPLVFPGFSENTHGVFFNRSGTRALGTGYYYDNADIDLYRVNKGDGSLNFEQAIRMQAGSDYAAFTHYVAWLDERFAVTASMQFGATSLTPDGSSLIPPSVWLIDSFDGTAEKILGSTHSVFGNGVLRSPSDIQFASGKLILAEEDTLDNRFGDDGFISIFDFSDRRNPVLQTRLSPGVELPEDFRVAHGISISADERFAMVLSYASAYIVKVDLNTNEVRAVFGPDNGLTMPHGGFISGGIR